VLEQVVAFLTAIYMAEKSIKMMMKMISTIWMTSMRTTIVTTNIKKQTMRSSALRAKVRDLNCYIKMEHQGKMARKIFKISSVEHHLHPRWPNNKRDLPREVNKTGCRRSNHPVRNDIISIMIDLDVKQQPQ
jgi:hypothetical protein